MTTRTRVIAAAAAATLLAATVTGCELLSHIPAPTPDPPRATATQTETAQERTMRLDKEAAEQAYISAMREGDRLARAGGATEPTQVLRETTDGQYRRITMGGLQILKKNGWRTDRAGSFKVTADGGWTATKLGLTACEDASDVRLLDRHGKEVSKDRYRRFVQTLTATKTGDSWKITAVDSKVVKTFANESGCEA